MDTNLTTGKNCSTDLTVEKSCYTYLTLKKKNGDKNFGPVEVLPLGPCRATVWQGDLQQDGQHGDGPALAAIHSQVKELGEGQGRMGEREREVDGEGWLWPPGSLEKFSKSWKAPRGSASLGWPEEIVSLPADGRKKIFVGHKPKKIWNGKFCSLIPAQMGGAGVD